MRGKIRNNNSAGDLFSRVKVGACVFSASHDDSNSQSRGDLHEK